MSYLDLEIFSQPLSATEGLETTKPRVVISLRILSGNVYVWQVAGLTAR
jgi:hypothetical protein